MIENIYNNRRFLRFGLLLLGIWICLEFRDTLWILILIAIITTLSVLFTLGKQAKFIVALPQLILLIYLFQYFIASLVLYFFPPIDAYDIGITRYPLYLAFVLPCCMALSLGFILAEPEYINLVSCSSKDNIPNWAKNSEKLIWAGIIFFLVAIFYQQYTFLNFAIHLISNLRFVGLFSLTILKNSKWKIYALILLCIEVINTSYHGMFGNILIWSTAYFLIIAFTFSWQKRLVAGIIFSFLFLIILQAAKIEFRDLSWDKEYSASEKLSMLGSNIYGQITSFNLLFKPEMLATTFVRFNQGWVIDRVMARVPSSKPFAEGETIYQGLYATFVPRFVDPDKLIAGGRLNFERFTGLLLTGNTSMTIGVVGEMYANYGIVGGIFGMAVFGFLLGFLYYKFLYKKAIRHSVWYAWGPFVGYYAMKAEEGLMETTTWIFKSILVMVLVIFISNKLTAKFRPAG